MQHLSQLFERFVAAVALDLDFADCDLVMTDAEIAEDLAYGRDNRSNAALGN